MASFKLMKVFDCQWDPGMPDDVKDAFFALTEEVSGNDVYVQWTIKRNSKDKDQKKVDDWFVANGATLGESVIIKRWW